MNERLCVTGNLGNAVHQLPTEASTTQRRRRAAIFNQLNPRRIAILQRFRLAFDANAFVVIAALLGALTTPSCQANGQELAQEFAISDSDKKTPLQPAEQIPAYVEQHEDDILAASAIELEPSYVESTGETVFIETQDMDEDELSIEEQIGFGDWLGYNSTSSDTSWLIDEGDGLGIFSLQSFPSLDIGESKSAMLGMSIHWLNGPVRTDLPARLYDLHWAYQARGELSDNFLYDMRLGVGAFTDFEGSVRKGIRFPGHVVGHYQWHPWFVSVLGVEVFDRDDISVLPVVGAVWRPRDDLIFEAIFPRPKVQLRIGRSKSLYLAGEIGGGTWAIERSSLQNDNATYHDLRLVLGMLDFEDDSTAIEFGWAFDRSLEYRSGIGNYDPDDAFLLRFRTLY
ncbi:MAG: hypothetical protein ACE361_06460 [Aureliella sp.]